MTSLIWFVSVLAASPMAIENRPATREYVLADFTVRTPDRKVSRWRDMRVAVWEPGAGGATFGHVLLDAGLRRDRLRIPTVADPWPTDADVVVLADGAGPGSGPSERPWDRLYEFVRRGGICWILSHEPGRWNPRCLPERLRGPAPARQYGLRCAGRKAPHYVCPWLVQRHHAVFNHPQPLDESDFTFWNPVVEGEACFTAALSALPAADGWDVLARYADPANARGALILQAPEGEGLYFWTQILSPQIVWSQPDAQARRTWEKLLENILTWFVAFRRGEVWRMESEPRPWSVGAGQQILLRTNCESALVPERVEAEVTAPDGSQSRVRMTRAGQGVFQGTCTPTAGGEHKVRVGVRFRGGAEAHDHFFFKVTKGWTAYRSVAHIHLRDCNGYGTQCPGGLFGAARRLGYDVLQAAPIADDGRLDDLRAADNPACRMIPGAELHYRLRDRDGGLAKHAFEDLRAVGLSRFIAYDHRILEDDARRIVGDLIGQVHAQGGLVFGNPGAFWAKQGLPLDGIELDMGLGFSWGKPLARYSWAPDVVPVDNVEVHPGLDAFWSEHRPIWALAAVDCHGLVTLLTRRSWNCVWLDKPLTIANYLAAVKAGRLAAVSRIDRVWLDVAGQPMGGTVYAVDEVPIRFRIDAGEPPPGIGAIRWPSATPKLSPLIGDLEFHDQRYYRPDEQAYVIPPEALRTLRRVELLRNGRVVRTWTPNSRAAEAACSDRVAEDSWYCLRAESSDGCAQGNPVFVKRIAGPPGAWLRFDGQTARVAANPQKRRWEVRGASGGALHFCLPGQKVSLLIDGKAAGHERGVQTGSGKANVPAQATRVEISWEPATPG